MLLKLVLLQSVIVTALYGYIVTEATRLICTGSAELCADVQGSPSSLAISTTFALAVFYGFVSFVAYRVSKSGSKTFKIILIVLQALILLTAVGSLISVDNNVARILHGVTALFAVAVLVATKRLSR